MAHHQSAKKRIRRNARRTEINRARTSRIRTHIRSVEEAIAGGNKESAQTALRAVQPELHKGVGSGVLHRNTAARKISRLAARVKAMA